MRALDLFAGAGGLALGAARAGFEHALLVDRDPAACETLRTNIGRGALEGLVAEADVATCEFSPHAGRIDVIFGGPPCQPFSIGGGHAGGADPRDGFPGAARAVAAVRPRAFLFENVRGLARPAFADYLSALLRKLAHAGEDRPVYNVSVHVANAADYGVPQSRSRAFIVGTPVGSPEFQMPRPTHQKRPSAADLARGVSPWVTAREALARPLLIDHGPLDRDARPGAKIYPGHTGSLLDAPAKAVRAGTHGASGGENMLRLDDGSVRYMSLRECARIQTFPDSWAFTGNATARARQIGNAVPVLLAQRVAEALRDHPGLFDGGRRLAGAP